MKILVFCMLYFLMSFGDHSEPIPVASAAATDIEIFTEVNLAGIGLEQEVFELALKGREKLVADGRLHNPDILTIADYSQSSNKKRLYVIDLKNRRLLFNTYVAHGKNTGGEYAKYFSNIEGSLKSSLGFYITGDPIVGLHTGYALLISGVEKGFNDNAGKREIIIHAADYASESFIKKFGRLGRSFGCPALPPDVNRPIIETIRGGTCLFIYNPDIQYLCKSELLN